MKIAIIGSGISGLVCAHKLHGEHEITVYEANGYIGGHTNTVPVSSAGRTWHIDTGFIVYNEHNYPQFSAILAELGVATQESEMSFSVRNERTGLEYNGHSLRTLFAQKRNLLSPRFLGMLRDILRFNKAAKTWLDSDEAKDPGHSGPTLAEFLARHQLGANFTDNYLVPMASAIWSMPSQAIHQFPLASLARFMDNHRMLQVGDRPVWRTITGGSWAYVRAMTAPFRDRIHIASPVEALRRSDIGVHVRVHGEERLFDEVIIAVHSDQALRLLADPSEAERDVLGAITYQPNRAVLHTDRSLMPQRRQAWAAWNAHVGIDDGTACVTYNSNILQRLRAPDQFLVTLGHHQAIDQQRILRQIDYAHPFYDADAVTAQGRHAEISGQRHTHYAGAYWGHGFHEDGVVSGLRVCSQLGVPA